MGKRDKLIHNLRSQELSGRKRALPVVSLENFFEGNDDYGSIGCNLSADEHPGPQGFYEILRAIRQREDVQDVLVEIHEWEEDEEAWPFSERIYILTTATPNDVAQWVACLHPDDVSEGYAFGKPPFAPISEPGQRVFSVWWD